MQHDFNLYYPSNYAIFFEHMNFVYFSNKLQYATFFCIPQSILKNVPSTNRNFAVIDCDLICKIYNIFNIKNPSKYAVLYI